MNINNEFEKRFNEEIIDMLILTNEAAGGGAVKGDMLIPSLYFVASVNLNTGELSSEKGRIEWIIKNSPDRTGWGYDFEQFKIYHIKARKSIPVELKEYMSEAVNNCYMVVDVIDEDVSEPRLDEIKKEISKTIIIDDEQLGKFVLDRKFSWFEGNIEWLEDECGVFLETDEEDGNTAEKSLAVLRKLNDNLEQWDKKFREYAADKLTDLANDWLEEDEEAEDGKTITKEEFADRIEISELSVSPEGDLTLYYYDDDMFWGHVIEIDANINGEISQTNIAG